MHEIKYFKVPKDYCCYLIWRNRHQRDAVWLMLCAAIYAIMKFIF